MSSDPLWAIAQELGGSTTRNGKSVVLTVSPDRVREACGAVSSLPGLYHLSTITGLDQGSEIAIHYHFWEGKEFFAVKTTVPKSDPRLPSISEELPAALLYEAEVKDLLGVTFVGNPFMKGRLLLPDDYPKDLPPPLRKEADPAEIRRRMGLD